MVVEYDGTSYCGFQLQVQAPTIQAELERAVSQLTGVPTRVHGASRTDSGTHARGQVVALSTGSPLPVQTFVSGMNAHLSRDITIREAYQVSQEFEPRRHATSRVYRYTILNRPARSPVWERWAYHVPERLDTERMDAALRPLHGTHDFAAFAGHVPIGKSTVRRMVDTRVWREDERVLVEMEANAFLPGQVRRTVGALLQVGRGKLPPEALRAMLEGQSPQKADFAAPAKGLCLMRINYKDFPPQ
jgi:tRNA pseudouridine38-40 synthase